MLILHIALLSIAIVSSYSENKTSPITFTISKVIDLTKPSTGSLKPKPSRGSKSSKNPISISKRQDPSFPGSLSTFDEPSGAIYSDSFAGFSGSKPGSKDTFDIDDIDVTSNPSFNLEDSTIQSGSSFGIADHKIKEPSTFDSPSFSLDGGSFNDDDAAFNIDSPGFDDEESQNKEEEDPPFAIDPSDFDINESTTEKPSSFETDFGSAKRSPPYNSAKGQRYSESSDDYKSTPRGKSYDSGTKEYKYSKNQGQRYSESEDSYSDPTSGPVYSDTNVQYVGSSATPISYITTPYYDKFNSPLVANGPKTVPVDQAFKGFDQSSFQNSLFDQGSFNQYPFQNLNGNSFQQSQHSAPPATQVPIYTTQYPGPKNSKKIFSPTHQTVVSFSPSTQSFEALSQKSFTNSPLNYNAGVTSLPSGPGGNKAFSGFIQGVEAEPIVLNSGSSFNFQAPNFGIPFNFGKENEAFLASGGHQQRQIVPVQTAGSSPQFPQYKGASVQAHSRSDYANPPGYQFLSNQPQLHFNGNQGSVDRVHNFNSPYPFERIRTDVEVINKKKPNPPQNDEDEGETEEETDEELDDGYKDIEQEYGRSDEDETSNAQVNSEENFSEASSSEEPEFKGMPPMAPFVFRPYDEKIGKLRDFVDHSQPQSRFSSESSAEGDEDYSPKKYSSSSAEYDVSEDDEELKRLAKLEEERPDIFSGKGLSAIRNYDLQFKKKFNGPYKNAASQTKYAQDRTSLPDNSKYKRKKNSQEVAESLKKNVKAGIDSPIKRPSKTSEDETKLNFEMNIFDKSFGFKIPQKLEPKQKLANGKKTSDSSSRIKKDNSRQNNSSKKNDKSILNKQSREVTDSLIRPSQAVKNIAYLTEDDYNIFSPQRIKSELGGSLF